MYHLSVSSFKNEILLALNLVTFEKCAFLLVIHGQIGLRVSKRTKIDFFFSQAQTFTPPAPITAPLFGAGEPQQTQQQQPSSIGKIIY